MCIRDRMNPLPEYLLLAGKIYYDLDNIEKAMNFYKKSMEKNFYDSYIKLGNLFYELKDYDSSYNTFEKFLQAYPDSYDARILYSTLSYVKNLFGEREKHLYINIIDKTSEYLDPNYLFNVKKWPKDLILKIQEIIKIV